MNTFAPNTVIKSAEINANFAEILASLDLKLGYDAWNAFTTSCVWVSAQSFKVVGADATAIFKKGTRIKWNQSGTRYAVVDRDSTFATDTTVTILPNNDYVIDNAAITSVFYSYTDSPLGFPGGFTYTPTPSGHSGGTIILRYEVVGKSSIEFSVYYASSGSGSASNYSLTLPATAAAVSSFNWTGNISRAVNSGSTSTTNDYFEIPNGSNVATLFKNDNSNGWTGSGNRSAQFQGFFEF